MGGKQMDSNEGVVDVMVASALRYKETPQVLENFLYVVDNVGGLTDENIRCVVSRLKQKLEEDPTDKPRLLFGIELVSFLCERRFSITIGVDRVLRQYAKILTSLINNRGLHLIGPRDDCVTGYEVALDIAQVLAVSASSQSTGTMNDLIRTIVAKVPEEVLKAKMEQLESPDFFEESKEDRARFYDVFVIEYLKRFYGMNKVMERLRERSGLLNTVRIDTSGRRYCSMDESKLWQMLRSNCEITDPTQNQHLDRQLITAELVRRHGEDNVVKDWYEENFPQLVRD